MSTHLPTQPSTQRPIPGGVLVINKPPGLTSHDVVQRARHALGIKQIGHAGTLDPMAEGVLVLLVGSATTYQRVAQGHRKRYEAVITLGIKTDTGDRWGRVVQTAPVPSFSRVQVEAVLISCLGPLTQIPPLYSAVKVRGRPLYWWARRGEAPIASQRTIEIFALELIELAGDRIRCRVECSAGTYIRCLAEEIAERLGTTGHVSQLIRLSVGPWDLYQAVPIERLTREHLEALLATIHPVETIHACAHRT